MSQILSLSLRKGGGGGGGGEVFISPIRVVCKAWDALATMNLSIEKNMYITTKILPIVKICLMVVMMM